MAFSLVGTEMVRELHRRSSRASALEKQVGKRGDREVVRTRINRRGTAIGAEPWAWASALMTELRKWAPTLIRSPWRSIRNVHPGAMSLASKDEGSQSLTSQIYMHLKGHHSVQQIPGTIILKFAQ